MSGLAWRKSSRSGGESNACVEVAWFKSSHSDPDNNCVEVAWAKSSRSDETDACVEVQLADAVGMRDSKDPDGPVLTFGAESWRAFVAGVNAGDFDR